MIVISNPWNLQGLHVLTVGVDNVTGSLHWPGEEDLYGQAHDPC